MAADRPVHQTKVEAAHEREAKTIDTREHLLETHLQQGHGDVHTLHGKDLIAASQTWQEQFHSLPLTKDGKIDTAQFTKDDPRWTTIEKMVNELNRPGGAIHRAEATVNQITKDLGANQVHLAQDTTHPQRSKA